LKVTLFKKGGRNDRQLSRLVRWHEANRTRLGDNEDVLY
jgi:hypothetical protein